MTDAPLTAREDRGSVFRHLREIWFEQPLSRGQIAFDVVFGLLAPVACWYLDATLSIGGEPSRLGMSSNLLGFHPGGAVGGVFTLVLLIACVATFLVSARDSAVLAGLLVASAVYPLAIGLLALPLAVLVAFVGLFALTLLAFVPLFTSFVCLREASRAWAGAVRRRGRAAVRWRFGTALLLGLLVPTVAGRLVEVQASSAVDVLRAEDSGAAEASLARLRALHPILFLAGADPSVGVAYEWIFAEDDDERAGAARAFERLTGERPEDSRLVEILRPADSD